MAFQVPKGDAILAQIEWPLAAVENEHNNLQSLTNRAVHENSQSVTIHDIFEHIILNCKQVPAHSEEIFNKYAIVSEKPDPQKSKIERWSQSILMNWRKIEWTTEKGGDLNTLRNQIMVHTNSLSLHVNINTSSRAASIEQSLSKKLTLLEELHQWYVVNLKETTSKRSKTSDELICAPNQPAQVFLLTFELAKKTEKGDEILCPCLALRSEWIESFLDGTLGPGLGCTFACNCSQCHVGLLSQQVTVQRYGYIRHLEDTFFRTLSSRRAGDILAQGVGNRLCYISQEDEEQHILEAISDLSISQKSVESIIFRSSRTRHDSGGTQIHSAHWLEYAEVLISFNGGEAQESDDVVSMVLKLRRNTCTKLMERASVDMSIEGVGTHSDERTTAHNGLDVTFQFTTKSAAKRFHEKIENMQTELFVRCLQYPRSNKRVILNLQTARVECESLYIDDAEVIIVVDANAECLLIVVSRTRCTIISQVLVDDFFTFPSNRPHYTGSTYLVQIDDTGERKIYHYKNGFRNLSLSTTQANRIPELARSSVSLSIRDREQ
ncbi:hypothetical protein F4679DRAFT_570280 [Xylaria curta]|nr:hypothetical protein F4679DRAFT_570280 [Xylaria curta]